MATKMLAAAQNSNTNKQNQLKITNETLNSIFAAVVCVYWYTCIPLVCYMKIFEFKTVVDENILPNYVCLARKRFGVKL